METPGLSSITNMGCEAASVAKKKSGPCPAHAVPSLRSFGSKLSVIADRKSTLLDFASSTNSIAVFLSAAQADAIKPTQRNACLQGRKFAPQSCWSSQRFDPIAEVSEFPDHPTSALSS
jgi:hypothetical protein